MVFSVIIKGQKINDRYEIKRMIGEGGMANVYLAYDTILDRNVAVKVLRGDLANDEKFVRRFQREAISASSLSHPNIVEMYDVGEDDGKYFIVMEYVDGKTLKSLVKKRGPLTLSEVIDIMLQITSGMACAHNSYIIHRDIKPQNILIMDDGRVKITDFGIAMALNSNELTQTNSVMGSVHYLPPEQANGSGATIKSDIYSMGILMYELLTGKIPFKGENAVEIAIKQMNEQIPSVRDFDESIPQSIENIILKACAKNPKNRYESASEMYEDIKTALNPERSDEARIVYHFDEKELDTTKKIGKLTREEITKEKDLEIKEKKQNKALIIGGIIVGIIAFILLLVLVIIPSFFKTPDVTIPDVSDMTVKEAEAALKKLGFIINTDEKNDYSDTIKAGKVIETSPRKDRTVKKGTSITLVISLGMEGILAEDYVGENYVTVKTVLEAKGINVEFDEQEFTEDDNVDKDKILKQDIEKGTKLVPGDTITFTIPEIILVYPDFVNDDYDVDKATIFCEDNGVTLDITYKETNEYPEGSIIAQSRAAGTKVVKGVSIRITVAKAMPVIDVTGISIDNGNLELSVGKTKTLSLTYTPSNATKKEANFKSSDPKIATVSNSGVVTAISEGSAIITATSNGKSASIVVKVTEEVSESN